MAKYKTRIRFLDSRDKSFVSRKLKDACKKVIDEYNQNETLVSPLLRVGKFENGDWDLGFSSDMKKFKKYNLENYTNDKGELLFEELFKDFMEFLDDKEQKAKVEEEKFVIPDKYGLYFKDEEEQFEEDEVDESEEEFEEVEEEIEEEDNTTYRDYLKESLSEFEKTDFRYYLIKILLGESKGWSFLKDPKKLKGDEFDIVTPKNAKSIAKAYAKAQK